MSSVTSFHSQEVICNKQAEESKALKASCETDLAEALPALESAVSALKSLSKGDIVEVRTGILRSRLPLPILSKIILYVVYNHQIWRS